MTQQKIARVRSNSGSLKLDQPCSSVLCTLCKFTSGLTALLYFFILPLSLFSKWQRGVMTYKIQIALCWHVFCLESCISGEHTSAALRTQFPTTFPAVRLKYIWLCCLESFHSGFSLTSPLILLSLQMKLWNKYKVTSIPSLVFVDAATGKVVCRNGLLVVRDDPKGEIRHLILFLDHKLWPRSSLQSRKH